VKKILFLSSHNLASNPRLVKEIELALQNGYLVSVICFEFENWSKPLNDEIKNRLISKISLHSIPGNRKPFGAWLVSSLIFSIAGIGLILFRNNAVLLSFRSNKRTYLLWKEVKKMNEKFDLVIAHNPGSFYPAQLFAQKNKTPFGIDLEDYHPGETNSKNEMLLSKNLNRVVLPKANYVSAASSLILQYSEADLSKPLKNKQVVLNYFPSTEFSIPQNSNSDKLKLVWFSQNISFNRGLEQLIPSIANNDQVELHLYGNCDTAFKEQWIVGYNNIKLYPSLPQNELHSRLANYDIGLAIEIKDKNLNRDICITNKILAYFQSGLYILASKTKAQESFINEHTEHGMLTSLSTEDLKNTIQTLINQKQFVRASSIIRFEKAKKYCWEMESEKLVKIWERY
jgi:hypothetical protein